MGSLYLGISDCVALFRCLILLSIACAYKLSFVLRICKVFVVYLCTPLVLTLVIFEINT